jgi:hypothetical protein
VFNRMLFLGLNLRIWIEIMRVISSDGTFYALCCITSTYFGRLVALS